jgi:hypothetical protein
VGFFKDYKNMRDSVAERGGMPNLGDSFRDMGKAFDDRGEREILQNGITAMGVVRGLLSQVPGDRFAMSIPIEVHPPDGLPYTIDYVFPSTRMQSALSPGMQVPIKISRDDPQKIAVQWDAQNAAIAAAGGSMAAVQAGLAQTYGGAANAAMEQAMQNLRQGTQGNVPPMTSQPDAQSRIEKLDQLKQAGLIDETQYAAKKQQILDEL